VHYKIVYAEMGFAVNLQKYIVSIERSAYPIDWQYNRKTVLADKEQTFEVAVTFQFTKLAESDLAGDTNVVLTSWWRLDEDLFYPFTSKSSGFALSTPTALLLLSSVALF